MASRVEVGEAIRKFWNPQGLTSSLGVNVNLMNTFMLPLTYTLERSRYHATFGSHASI